MPPRDMSKINIGDSYNSTPTNSKVYLVDLESLSTYTSTSPYTIPSIVNSNFPKSGNSNILKQIWSRIFDNKQYPKEFNCFYVNENHCRKSKDN